MSVDSLRARLDRNDSFEIGIHAVRDLWFALDIIEAAKETCHCLMNEGDYRWSELWEAIKLFEAAP